MGSFTCAAYHDEHVLPLTARRIQVDEIWSFTYTKQRYAATAKGIVDHAGDTWTLTRSTPTAPLHSTDQHVLKEGRELRSLARAVHDVLRFVKVHSKLRSPR